MNCKEKSEFYMINNIDCFWVIDKFEMIFITVGNTYYIFTKYVKCTSSRLNRARQKKKKRFRTNIPFSDNILFCFRNLHIFKYIVTLFDRHKNKNIYYYIKLHIRLYYIYEYTI